jgi:transcriptional regulator with XRE-family HTH domain
MPEAGSVIPRRRLAAQLRRLREESGSTLEEVARELLISTSKLSRLENAQGLPQVRDVRDLARHYGVAQADLDLMMRWAEESRRRQWWQVFNVPADTDGDYLDYEGAASEIHGYSERLVPSMLQLPEYVRAQIVAMTPEEIGEDVLVERVEIRMKRQNVWRDAESATLIDIVVDESALLRQVGAAAVMRAQLQHISTTATTDRRIKIRVLQFASGPHWASQGGTFTVFKFPGGVPDVVNSDTPDKYFDDHRTTGRFLDRFDALCDRALSPEDSIDYIRRIATDKFPPNRK